MTYSLRTEANRQKTALYLKLKAEPIDGRSFFTSNRGCRFLADHDDAAFVRPLGQLGRQSAQQCTRTMAEMSNISFKNYEPFF